MLFNLASHIFISLFSCLFRYIKSLLTGPNDPDTETLIQENTYLKEKVAELEVLVRQLSSDPTEVVDAE
jgi:hypothetical protein